MLLCFICFMGQIVPRAFELNSRLVGCILAWTHARERWVNESQVVFSQLMAHGSRHVLDRCVRPYGGHNGVRSFSCRDQCLAMSFARLTHRESLRGIEACLVAVPDKPHRLDFRSSVSRGTLADTNGERDWRFHPGSAQRLVVEARRLHVDETPGLDGWSSGIHASMSIA